MTTATDPIGKPVPTEPAPTAEEARQQLYEIVSNGIALDVYAAEEVLALLYFTGANAAAINAANYGQFFGTMQRYLGHTLILSMAKIYETQKRYRLRSIPAALAHLGKHPGVLRIDNRAELEREVVRLGADAEALWVLSDGDLTLRVAAILSERLKPLREGTGDTLKTVRDKLIAHNEDIDATALPKATYAQIDQLIEYAKDFVSIIGHAYLGTTYRSDDRRYWFTSDAERATRCLRRLLDAAGVARPESV